MTNEIDTLNIEITKRIITLRKQGKFKGTVYCDGGKWSLSANDMDPYGSRVHVGLQEMVSFIESLETEKKGPGKIAARAAKRGCA